MVCSLCIKFSEVYLFVYLSLLVVVHYENIVLTLIPLDGVLHQDYREGGLRVVLVINWSKNKSSHHVR